METSFLMGSSRLLGWSFFGGPPSYQSFLVGSSHKKDPCLSASWDAFPEHHGIGTLEWTNGQNTENITYPCLRVVGIFFQSMGIDTYPTAVMETIVGKVLPETTPGHLLPLDSVMINQIH